jgi:protein ImuB
VFAAVLAARADRALQAVARDFSPRIEVCSDREVLLDVHGLERLIGTLPTISAELHRTAAAHGLDVRVAIAATRTAARLLVHAHPGRTVIDPGDERDALAGLPIELLTAAAGDADLRTLRRWGLRTLGDLAALPDEAVAARLGQHGVAWQRLARGEDPGPLVPASCPPCPRNGSSRRSISSGRSRSSSRSRSCSDG